MKKIFPKKYHYFSAATLFLLFIVYAISTLSAQKEKKVSSDNYYANPSNNILVLTQKPVKDKKINSTSFDVYLLEQINKMEYNKTMKWDFTMQFTVDKEINNSGFMDFGWYNIAETAYNHWIFANKTNNYGFSVFSIDYSSKDKILNHSVVKSLKDFSHDGWHYIVSFDSNNGYLVSNYGSFYSFGTDSANKLNPTGLFNKANSEENRKQKKEVTSSVTLPLDCENMIYYKWCSESNEAMLTKITLNRKLKDLKQSNKLTTIISDLATNAKAVSISAGQQVFYRPFGDFSPMSASPNRKKIGFTSNYTEQTNSEPVNHEKTNLWLAVWDTEKNEIDRIVVMPPQEMVAVMPFTMLWCPAPDSALISFYTYEGLFIVDVNEHRIKKILFKGSLRTTGLLFINIIRWSPDGSMLGILRQDGSLFVYNVAKDKLTKINSDKECFNFVWVK